MVGPSTPGGVTFAKIVHMDVPAAPQKFDFLYTNFSPNYPPNFAQIGCFLQQFAQNTPNSFISKKNLPIAIPNFMKKYLKRQAHTYTCTMSM